MADPPLLDPQFVRFLRDNRRMIVPFTGAGVSADAGVPVADELALLIASSANDRDAGIVRNDFAGVCADVTAALGRSTVQEIIATVVSGLDARPTPLLRLIARAPSQIVLTST